MYKYEIETKVVTFKVKINEIMMISEKMKHLFTHYSYNWTKSFAFSLMLVRAFASAKIKRSTMSCIAKIHTHTNLPIKLFYKIFNIGLWFWICFTVDWRNIEQFKSIASNLQIHKFIRKKNYNFQVKKSKQEISITFRSI